MLALSGTCVVAEKKVFEITSAESFGGLYFETNKAYKFRKLGGPDADDYHFYLFKEYESFQRWYIGDGKKGEQITKSYKATASSPSVRALPQKGWKSVDFPYKEQQFNVVERASVKSTLTAIENSGGSFTTNGGIICLGANSNRWILLRKGQGICDKIQDCKNKLDESENENCKHTKTTMKTRTTTATTTIASTPATTSKITNDGTPSNPRDNQVTYEPNKSGVVEDHRNTHIDQHSKG